MSTPDEMTMRGKTKTTDRHIQAKWLGADRGDLKPFDPKR